MTPTPTRPVPIRPLPVRPGRMPLDVPGLGTGPADILQRIEWMERLLEGAFVIPGTNRRVGLDAIIGLLPVAGDAITAAMGAWIVFEARLLGVPKWKLMRMSANVAFDFALGAVPLLGDALDFLFRSNSINLKIIRRHIERHHPELRTINQR
ncbi:DUF4112 domain-containing protein [Novosphingobium sp.]|uniref:DUF4112 domain-containing protein n=1 Tax=Novosphingobium sp. TaxID=1874826 RepID=UPI003452E3DA